jgi:hypothetical protein
VKGGFVTQEFTQAEREMRLATSIEWLKAALAYEKEHPDYSQPTPAEAARKLAERMEEDARRAVNSTRFARFTG